MRYVVYDGLSPKFILSEEIEKQKFYDEIEVPDYGNLGTYIYDGIEMNIENMDFLEKYDKNGNIHLVSSNEFAKMLFNKEIKETKTISPISLKEIDAIVEKIFRKQIKQYKLDKNEKEKVERFFKDNIKSEILEIIFAENEEEALKMINESIFFSPEEKKCANKVVEQKNLYFTNFIPVYIAQKAIEQNIKVGDKISLRSGIFKKTYKVHPRIYAIYVNILLEEVSNLEKIEITDTDNSPVEVTDRIEEIREILKKIISLDPKNKMYNYPTKRYIRYLYSLKVLEKLFDKKVKLEILSTEIPENWDKYLYMGIVKMFIENIDMNILVYTFKFKNKKLDKVVRKLAWERIKKVKKFIKDNNIDYSILKDKYKYNKYTIEFFKNLKF